jgi:hypothetical protein
MAKLRAEAFSAGCFSSRREVVRIETSVEDSGADRICGMKSGEVNKLQVRCNVVSRRG